MVEQAALFLSSRTGCSWSWSFNHTQ